MDDKLEIYFKKILGKGSFATVFLGKYKSKYVAVKIIYTKDLEPRIIRQLEKELEVIRLLQKYPHQNIVSYYHIIREYDRLIILMELCRGGELKKAIESNISMDNIRNYMKQIISGYRHLLSLNIIHRDLKSSNILLNKNNDTIRIIDFGLSKIITTDLNQTICGSPLYMAPELLNNHDYDSKSDIWSLGCIFYEMVYTMNPFQQCHNITILRSNINRDNIYYSKFRQDNTPIPKHVIRHMKQLLEPDTKKRIDWMNIIEYPWYCAYDGSEQKYDSSDSPDKIPDKKFPDKKFPDKIPDKIPDKKFPDKIPDKKFCEDFDKKPDTYTINMPDISRPIPSFNNMAIQHTVSKPIPIKNNNQRRSTVTESFGNIGRASLDDTSYISSRDTYFKNSLEINYNDIRQIDDTKIGRDVSDDGFINANQLHKSDIDLIKKNNSRDSSASINNFIHSKSAPVGYSLLDTLNTLTKKAGQTFGNRIR